MYTHTLSLTHEYRWRCTGRVWLEKGNLFSVFLRLDLKLGWQGISDDDLYRVREGCIQWELVVAKYRPLLDTNTARW